MVRRPAGYYTDKKGKVRPVHARIRHRMPRKRIKRSRRTPKTVYHVTPRRNVSSILSTGLKPLGKGGWGMGRVYAYATEPGYVYVYKRLNLAKSQKIRYTPTSILKIRTSKPLERDYDVVKYLFTAGELTPQETAEWWFDIPSEGKSKKQLYEAALRKARGFSDDEWDRRFGAYRIKGEIPPKNIQVYEGKTKNG